MVQAVVTGLLLSAVAVALWTVARPLRDRPRPPAEVSSSRFGRLAPLVMALLVVLGGGLVISLLVAAFR